MAGSGMKEIKTRIGSVESTKQITKAMELVASSKLRKAKEKAENSRPYFTSLYDTLKDISQNTRGVRSEFLNSREVKNKCYIVIAGDRGLAGGYNSNILKAVTLDMNNKKEKVITIGKKATEYFTKREYEVIHSVGSVEDCDYDKIIELTKKAMELYIAGEVDEVQFAYTKFISPLVQDVQLIKLLPLSFEDEDKKNVKRGPRVQYLPSPEVVLEYIIPNYVNGIVYGGLMESFASELGARRTAMESATDSANEMIEKLQLIYNRARQAAVTQEITEIVGGAEALK